MNNFLKLAERCEKASGPDRELDARIAVATYSDTGHDDQRDNTHARFPSRSDECAPGTYWISAFSGLSLRTSPNFTASLDAAMTLVPEGWVWDADATAPEINVFWRLYEIPDGEDVLGRAATPALALTAACLRARAAI